MVAIRKIKKRAAALILFSGQALGLQVTPGSPCTASCLDAADPSATTTSGSEIVCMDSDYRMTTTGKKYQDCLSCLQSSSYEKQDQNDQAWYLYNLRYAVDTCLFGFANASDSKMHSTPCTTSDVCVPLQTSLEEGMSGVGDQSEYSYCITDTAAFRGGHYSTCKDCLRTTDNQQYLANFVTALGVACDQRPSPGALLGLQGTIFSTVPVNGTFPGDDHSTSTSHHGLSQGGIIGIAVGLAILFLVAVAIMIVCLRKRKDIKRLQALRSPLNARFGAENITSPVDGAYGNPYSHQMNQATEPFDTDKLSKQELAVLVNARSVIAKHESDPNSSLPNGWQDVHAHLAVKLPEYTGATVPTHQAYMPSLKRSSVETGSTFTNNTYHASQYPSPRSSPKEILTTSPGTSPTLTPPARTPPAHIPHPIQIPQNHYKPALQVQPPVYVPPSKASPEFEDSSRVMPRAMHSQQEPQSATEARSVSRTDSRSQSRTRGWRFGTSAFGGESSSSSNTTKPPPRISAPIMMHGGRFDFEMADRERIFKEQQGQGTELHRMRDQTPDSADSEELWPGKY